MKPISRFDHVPADKTAIIVDQLTFSYGRLDADITSLSIRLTNHGVVARQSVAIFLRNPYWSWVCRLTALRMGLTQVTLPSRNFREHAAAMGRFDVALGEFNNADGAVVARKVIVFSPQGMAPIDALSVPAPAHPRTASQAEEEATYVLLTSGTTGKPKVVALCAERLGARLARVQSSQGLTAETFLLSTVGTNTMPGAGYSMATWQAGGCVVFTSHKNNLRTLPINYLLTTPMELHQLLKMDAQPWAHRETRKVTVVGGRLPIPVRDEALASVCTWISLDYGATETNCTATGDASLLDRHPGAVGFAVADATIEIVDRHGYRQTPGREGVVRTRTPYMVTGYGYDQDDKPEDFFREGWFYPGDLGILFEDGLLAITGRLSETLNVGGTKIPVLDFEAALQTLPGVQDYCAIVLKLDTVDRLAFLIVCDDENDLQALSAQITERLTHKVLFNLLRVTSIPRNAMGKIPRKALSEAYTEIYCREISKVM